jgi:Fur family transcriptional regulator, ferric uptake regulator
MRQSPGPSRGHNGDMHELAEAEQQPSVPELVEHVGQLLRARGERMTGPRKAVLAALAASGGHLGAEDVVTRVAEVDAGVHRASVYRTLDALCDLGVVQHVHIGHGATAYHLVHPGDVHVHAQCNSCGAVVDLPVDVLEGAGTRMRQEAGFVLDPTHVALSGTCAACAQPRTVGVSAGK